MYLCKNTDLYLFFTVVFFLLFVSLIVIWFPLCMKEDALLAPALHFTSFQRIQTWTREMFIFQKFFYLNLKTNYHFEWLCFTILQIPIKSLQLINSWMPALNWYCSMARSLFIFDEVGQVFCNYMSIVEWKLVGRHSFVCMNIFFTVDTVDKIVGRWASCMCRFACLKSIRKVQMSANLWKWTLTFKIGIWIFGFARTTRLCFTFPFADVQHPQPYIHSTFVHTLVLKVICFYFFWCNKNKLPIQYLIEFRPIKCFILCIYIFFFSDLLRLWFEWNEIRRKEANDACVAMSKIPKIKSSIDISNERKHRHHPRKVYLIPPKNKINIDLINLECGWQIEF